MGSWSKWRRRPGVSRLVRGFDRMTGGEVVAWREFRGLSQVQLAELLSRAGREVEPFDVARWEEGERRVPDWLPRALNPPPPPPPSAPKRIVTLKLEAIGDDTADAARRFAGFCRALGFEGNASGTGWRRPWVAEVTGRDPRYRYTRQFLDGRKDYSAANSIGSRGVYVYYHLEPGRIYEVNDLATWGHTDRYLCRVEDGRVIRMAEEEVLACLS